MVKHNNQIQLPHLRKKYCASSRGPLKVRLALNKAGRKKSRRLARAAKAAAIAPRPLQKLRPSVHCPTQKYSAKVRLGRGFTLRELKEAGIQPTFAQTIGIAVDHRRTNRSEEQLQVNVQRLKAYKDQLILFPKKRSSKASSTKAGMDSTAEECNAASQYSGTIQPLIKPQQTVVMGEVTEEMKAVSAVTTMKVARKETKVAGYRVAVTNRKKNE
jgi:large subunit ribosomal protein L13e